MANTDAPMEVEEVGEVDTNSNGNPSQTTDQASSSKFDTLLEVLASQQATLSALLAANGMSPAKEVRSVDVRLDPFSGGDRSACVLQPDSLIEFDAWYRVSVHKMRMFNLPATRYAACLIAHLDGPARASWFAKFPEAMDISAQQFYDDFCTLIPHYKLYCTTQYTACTFTPSTLVEDVERFISYVRFSGVMPNLNEHNEVVCDMFFQKLSASCSHLIEVARNQYGIHLTASDSLSVLAENAKAAARRYAVDNPKKYRVSHNAKGEYGAVLGQADEKPKNPMRQRKLEKRKASTMDAEYKPMASMPEEELLRKYQRCFKCGYKPKLNPVTGEHMAHECHAQEKGKRVEAMRKDLAKGKNPNEFPRKRVPK